MKPFLEIIRCFLRETEPSPFRVRRVRRRLATGDPDPAVIRRLLHALPEPLEGAEARIRARLAHPAPAPSRLAPVLGLAAVAAAAAVILALGLLPHAPEPLAVALSSDAAWSQAEPAPAVSLGFRGRGRVTGDEHAPRVLWESGTLAVKVEPGRGVALVVETREAEVRVVGTAFSVTRDALGTRVQVDHGRVVLRCLGAAEQPLDAGGDATCRRTTPATLLTRARVLESQGAPADEVLRIAEAALALDAAPELLPEIAVVRIRALASLGHSGEALAAAERYLEIGMGDPGRRIEIRRLAAGLAWTTGGCVGALPHLERLATDAPDAGALVRLADCVATTDPERARAALEQALPLAGADETAVRARLAGLAR